MRDVLPYTLEHGSKLLRLQVLSLLAKVTIQLANQLPSPESAEETKEPHKDNVDRYKVGCLAKAANFLT